MGDGHGRAPTKLPTGRSRGREMSGRTHPELYFNGEFDPGSG